MLAHSGTMISPTAEPSEGAVVSTSTAAALQGGGEGGGLGCSGHQPGHVRRPAEGPDGAPECLQRACQRPQRRVGWAAAACALPGAEAPGRCPAATRPPPAPARRQRGEATSRPTQPPPQRPALTWSWCPHCGPPGRAPGAAQSGAPPAGAWPGAPLPDPQSGRRWKPATWP